jgi:shikimate dehydrogenase
MHAAAYRALDLPHTYEAVRATIDDLPLHVERLRQGATDGINVTAPHKRHILSHVDDIDASASVVGAGNTLVRDQNGRIVAHNTDVPALAEELRHLAPEVKLADGWRTARALVLGTGATARSAIVALAYELNVAEIIVRGRALEEQGAQDRFGAEVGELLNGAGVATAVRLEPWRPSPSTDRSVSAIVQATSAGMAGADPGEEAAEAISWAALPEGTVALDVVYAPPETPFLRAAQAYGLRAASGLGMLARQGAIAFELWLGVPAPFDTMLATLR